MKHFLSQHNQIEDRLQTLRSVLTFCFGIGYIASALGEWLPAGNVHHGSAHQLTGALRRLQRIA